MSKYVWLDEFKRIEKQKADERAKTILKTYTRTTTTKGRTIQVCPKCSQKHSTFGRSRYHDVYCAKCNTNMGKIE